MGTKSGVDIFRGEFTAFRAVVGPCAPITNNLKGEIVKGIQFIWWVYPSNFQLNLARLACCGISGHSSQVGSSGYSSGSAGGFQDRKISPQRAGTFQCKMDSNISQHKSF